MKKFSVIATLLVIASCSVVYAQQQEPSSKPSISAQRAEPLPQLLLEVVFNKAMPPAYSNLNGPTEIGKWMSLGRFVRLPGSSPSSPPIHMVKLEPQFNGKTAAVRVSLLRGVDVIDREDVLGIYYVGLGEQKELTDLRTVGIEPFTISLINTVPPLPPPPSFVNDTKAIEIVSVRAENSPNPAYIVTLRNLSEKSVSAVGLDTTYDGRPGSTSLFRGEENRPLIEAGGTVERYVRAMIAQPGLIGFVPSAPSAITIHIRSAVFSDLTYDGDVKDACFMEAAAIGRKVYLTSVLALLDSQLAEAFTDPTEAARQFRNKFEALRYYDDYSAKPSSISTACTNMVPTTVNAVNAMKLDMLRDLDQIINTRPRPPFDFRAWMETRRASYNAWLARL